jgi:hypothetical protein
VTPGVAGEYTAEGGVGRLGLATERARSPPLAGVRPEVVYPAILQASQQARRAQDQNPAPSAAAGGFRVVRRMKRPYTGDLSMAAVIGAGVGKSKGAKNSSLFHLQIP